MKIKLPGVEQTPVFIGEFLETPGLASLAMVGRLLLFLDAVH